MLHTYVYNGQRQTITLLLDFKSTHMLMNTNILTMR